jgi:hypothetical protein
MVLLLNLSTLSLSFRFFFPWQRYIGLKFKRPKQQFHFNHPVFLTDRGVSTDLVLSSFILIGYNNDKIIRFRPLRLKTFIINIFESKIGGQIIPLVGPKADNVMV